MQYLDEPHGSELALVRQLQAQIAMTPKGQYRDGLGTIFRRLGGTPSSRAGWPSLGRQQPASGRTRCRGEPRRAGLGVDQDPRSSWPRDRAGEEKVLKNAKDSVLGLVSGDTCELWGDRRVGGDLQGLRRARVLGVLKHLLLATGAATRLSGVLVNAKACPTRLSRAPSPA